MTNPKPTHIVTTIAVDGSKSVQTIHRDDELKVLQAAVGGYIETVPHFNRYDGRSCRAYCNEDGIAKGFQINQTMTQAWRDLLGSRGAKYDPDMAVLVGPIAIIQTNSVSA